MRSKLKSMAEEEQSERDILDAETALQLQQGDDIVVEEWMSAISSMLAQDSRVNMTVYMFAANPDGLPMRTIHFQDFEMLRVRGGMLFTLSTEVRNPNKTRRLLICTDETLQSNSPSTGDKGHS